MATLADVRSALLIAFADDSIDYEEFLILYDLNISRELYPYWKFDKFDLSSWDDARCLSETRFYKRDLFVLVHVFRIPDKITTCQGTTCSGMEGLCILLKRLAFPCRFCDMVWAFGRSIPELCLIFNTMIDLMHELHGFRLESFNQPHLGPHKLQEYADTVHQKGAPLDNCFGFIDGTRMPISKPKRNQRVVYNGHKRLHALKFQSVALPNGLIGHLSGPYEGRKHDSGMLRESGLLPLLHQNAWSNGNPLCVYGDPAYPISVHLQGPFRLPNTAQQRDFNKAMSKVRIEVEWLFGDIKNFFKFIDFNKQLKIGLSSVGKYFLVCGLLHNARACLYGNLSSDYFGLKPPTIEEYFQ